MNESDVCPGKKYRVKDVLVGVLVKSGCLVTENFIDYIGEIVTTREIPGQPFIYKGVVLIEEDESVNMPVCALEEIEGVR